MITQSDMYVKEPGSYFMNLNPTPQPRSRYISTDGKNTSVAIAYHLQFGSSGQHYGGAINIWSSNKDLEQFLNTAVRSVNTQSPSSIASHKVAQDLLDTGDPSLWFLAEEPSMAIWWETILGGRIVKKGNRTDDEEMIGIKLPLMYSGNEPLLMCSENIEVRPTLQNEVDGSWRLGYGLRQIEGSIVSDDEVSMAQSTLDGWARNRRLTPEIFQGMDGETTRKRVIDTLDWATFDLSCYLCGFVTPDQTYITISHL